MGRVYRDMGMKKPGSQHGVWARVRSVRNCQIYCESQIQKRVEAALDVFAAFATGIGLAEL
jgi:hypothetical protein